MSNKSGVMIDIEMIVVRIDIRQGAIQVETVAETEIEKVDPIGDLSATQIGRDQGAEIDRNGFLVLLIFVIHDVMSNP